MQTDSPSPATRTADHDPSTESPPVVAPASGDAAASTPTPPPAVASAAASSALPALRLLKIAIVFLAAVLLCVVGYLAVAVPGAWFPQATPRAFVAKDLVVTRGNGSLVGDELVITSADATGNILVTLTSDFRSADYAGVAWIAIDLPETASVRVFWRTDYRPDRLNSVGAPVESGRILPVLLKGNPEWLGKVTGLALAIKGTLTTPLHIRGVVVKPMGAMELLRDRAGEWFAFEAWTGTSINTVTGGADVQDLPLPMLLAAAALLTIVASLVWFRVRHRGYAVPIAGVMISVFASAWFLLDARWTWNLARQVTATGAQYGGKDLRDKHLAMEDGQLYTFVEKARTVLPKEPARIFVMADAPFFRNRAAYHLYPHNVFSEPLRNAIPPASVMRSGDWIVVYLRRGVQFDASQQKLRWDDQTIPAELKLVEPGAALFRIP